MTGWANRDGDRGFPSAIKPYHLRWSLQMFRGLLFFWKRIIMSTFTVTVAFHASYHRLLLR